MNYGNVLLTRSERKDGNLYFSVDSLADDVVGLIKTRVVKIHPNGGTFFFGSC